MESSYAFWGVLGGEVGGGEGESEGKGVVGKRGLVDARRVVDGRERWQI